MASAAALGLLLVWLCYREPEYKRKELAGLKAPDPEFRLHDEAMALANARAKKVGVTAAGQPTEAALADDGFQTYARPDPLLTPARFARWKEDHPKEPPGGWYQKKRPVLGYDGGMTRDEDEIDRIRRKNRGEK